MMLKEKDIWCNQN